MTPTIARNGAPTSPGPSPTDRVSPPGALGSGDAAATTGGPATRPGQPPLPGDAPRGPNVSRAIAQMVTTASLAVRRTRLGAARHPALNGARR
jgi:hypothetical protein